MRKMPVISTDKEVNKHIEEICKRFNNYFIPVFIDSKEEALETIRYDLPEVNVINFSDPVIDGYEILNTIKADPWLHYGGIIGIHFRRDGKELEQQMQGSNIISLIPRKRVIMGFHRVLKILTQNRQILFQRDLQNYLMTTISGSFEMDNDPFNVSTYSNLITNYLYNSNYIKLENKDRLHVAVFEMLMNAIEHGNCRISYEEKTKWLEDHGDILDLIREKCKNAEIRKKKVYFSYRITHDRSYFTIKDEGQGFDWRSRMSAEENEENLGLHGRGIRMTDYYIENLRYNEHGNEVSFEMPHNEHESNVIPGIFNDQAEIVFHNGDVIFKEGEESNFLYYIVSGTLDIYSKNQKISELTADDIFLGEMSFLLNNKRSATVVANGKAVLVKISKIDFVNVIKQKPHYGIFLARLIASRLSKLNAQVAAASGGLAGQ